MLLDTHALVWLLDDAPHLGPLARQRLAEVDEVMASATSSWEIATKTRIGKLVAPADLLDQVERAGLRWLPITPAHTWATLSVTGLHHGDPFDRLLVAQAQTEGLDLLTADRALLAADLPITTHDARA